MLKKVLVLTLIVVLPSIYTGCGPKIIKPESVLDTPENHYRNGMRMLERDDLSGAVEEFNRAKGMDPKYPEAYSGLALVDAKQGQYKEAHMKADKAISLDGKNRIALITKARIYAYEHKGDDWWEDAVKLFDKALKYHHNDSEAQFYLGETYKLAYKFSEAVTAYSKVVAKKDDWSERANADWELVQKIVRAAPGTKIGAKIAIIDKIDRSDVAVLFMEELKLPVLLEKKREKVYDTSFKAPDDPMKYQQKTGQVETGPTDIANHWAKNWIAEIVEIGGMEMFPDHTFHPDELFTRAEYAMFIQNILILVTGDESIATKFFGEDSHYPDVSSSHPAYNAIVLCIQRGIMKTNMDGSFGMSDNVSGADALLIIREFQNNLRMTF
ncbi:MAG: S-layer homology domain-containing protein [candidate division Zixibacteria bacterium]|nr:S-layer homology domain-containing protein [Candidatus Tariuqbacter arcticus]